MTPAAASPSSAWRRTLRLTRWLLALWFGSTVGVVFFARALDVVVGGFRIGFWLAAQVLLVLYVVIVGFYAWQMDRVDASSEPPSTGGHDDAREP